MATSIHPGSHNGCDLANRKVQRSPVIRCPIRPPRSWPSSTAQLKEYLLGFSEAAVLALDELIRRGEDGATVIQELEAGLHPASIAAWP